MQSSLAPKITPLPKLAAVLAAAPTMSNVALTLATTPKQVKLAVQTNVSHGPVL